MPYKETKVEKLFYTIGEVADMFGVNTSLIRFWEKNFSIIRPKKNKKGNRLFTSNDIENFKLIYHLVKEQRLTLEGARKKLQGGADDSKTNMEALDSLKRIRAMLVEIEETL